MHCISDTSGLMSAHLYIWVGTKESEAFAIENTHKEERKSITGTEQRE